MTLNAQIINFLLREGNGLAACAYEACCTADIVDKMPAVIGKHHLAQHIAGEHLALDGFLACVGELGDCLERDVYLVDQIRHVAVFRCLHNGGSNCVLIPGIGMDHIPFCIFCHNR